MPVWEEDGVPVWQRSPRSPAGQRQRPVAGSQPAPCSQSQRSRQPAPWKPAGQPGMESSLEHGRVELRQHLQQSLPQPSREKQRAFLAETRPNRRFFAAGFRQRAWAAQRSGSAPARWLGQPAPSCVAMTRMPANGTSASSGPHTKKQTSPSP